MYILNTFVLDQDYTTLSVPLKKLVPVEHYNFADEFYGGRVSHIGVVKDSDIMLLIDNETDGIQIIDTAINDLNKINCDVLKNYAKSKKIEFDWRKTTKEELIELIKPRILYVKQLDEV